MFKVLYRLLVGGLLCTLLSLLIPTQLRWLGSLDRDLWDLPDAIRFYMAVMRNRQQLEYQETVMMEQNRSQNRLIRDLLAGRRSLTQVATCFKYLWENPPGEEPAPLHFPGSSRDEKICRKVISCVKWYMFSYPDSYDEAFLVRLQKELVELLARPGGLQLATRTPNAL
jgi:hypothetical protein